MSAAPDYGLFDVTAGSNGSETRDDAGDATTVAGSEIPAPGRLGLLVVGDGTFATHPLPDAGEVTIGRSEKNTIRINEPSISREHAILRTGERMTIEDLGSANGTRIGERRLAANQRVEIFPDQVIDLGSTLVIVQRAAAPRPRRLCTHGYFEARLEDECARADRRSISFAVVRLDVSAASTAAGTVADALSIVLSSGDVVGAYGPDEYELLLVDVAPERATAVVESIRGLLADRGLIARTGIACHPLDGRTPEALIARACAAVRGARADDGAVSPVVIEDGAMQELHRVVDRIAQGTISVLLLGETGVGKEVLAETVHGRSPRASKPFIRLNCAALSESLLESELFGYEKGAFTGALSAKKGLLETADGGTLFLDEVGELPMTTQVKFLRVLETRQVLPVGALEPRAIDVRIISATNRDLEQEIAHGRFRTDLFFRLNGISLLVPPLRERITEIQPLAEEFIRRASRESNIGEQPKLTDDALDLLERYSWPGNIRELRNVIERAVLLTTDATIRPEHLPLEKMRSTMISPTWSKVTSAPTLSPEDKPRRGQPSPEERRRILDALDRSGGNQTQAAKLLGVSRRTLVSRLDVYGLPRPRKSGRE